MIAFGGSILAPETPDPERVRAVAEALREWSTRHRILVVVGGGRPARNAMALARPAGASREDLDRVGIAATRLNAQTLLAVLRALGVRANREVPEETGAAAGLDRDLVVMGGTVPGHSTDQVAVELALKAGAVRVVIATNVDGVYTADPRKDPKARRLAAVTHDELLKIVGGPEWTEAGAPGVVDGPAAALLLESGLEARVVSGDDLDNVGKAVSGEDFHGTLVTGGV